MTPEPADSDAFSPEDRFVHQTDPERPLSEAVIAAIAEQEDGADLTTVADDLEPLYDAIDPAALDALFASTRTRERSEGAVSFSYAGRYVTVDTTGRVELVPEESKSEPETTDRRSSQ